MLRELPPVGHCVRLRILIDRAQHPAIGAIDTFSTLSGEYRQSKARLAARAVSHSLVGGCFLSPSGGRAVGGLQFDRQYLRKHVGKGRCRRDWTPHGPIRGPQHTAAPRLPVVAVSCCLPHTCLNPT